VNGLAISHSSPVTPVHAPEHVQRPKPAAGATTPAPKIQSFDQILKQKVDSAKEVVFSAHARDRLIHRNIQLSPHDLERLQGGVQKAAVKGAREALVLLNELAFVVSVPNRTVITAMMGDALKGNIFTQIDSAVIV
jgi:flagellar operon protein